MTDKYLAAITGGATYVKGNEAAERLQQAFHIWASEGTHPDTWLGVLHEALAAERRAYFDELLVAGLIAPKGLTYEATRQATERLTRDIADVSRRATVERIEKRVDELFAAGVFGLGAAAYPRREKLRAILDEEAKGHHPTGESYATGKAAR